MKEFLRVPERVPYLIEGMADVAQILPDHLLAEPLPRDEKPGHSRGRVVQEALPNMVAVIAPTYSMFSFQPVMDL